MPRKPVLCLLTAVLALTAAPAAADPRPPVPQQDSFYTPPSPLPQARPGDVLRTREVQLYAEPFRVFPAPVRAHQVLYRSTSAPGQPNAVSGTVIVLPVRWLGGGPRPVLAYARSRWATPASPASSRSSGGPCSTGRGTAQPAS